MGWCRLSDTLEQWEDPESKRMRTENDMAVKVECDNANDAYAFASPNAPVPATAPAMSDAPSSSLAPAPIPTIPLYVPIYNIYRNVN